MITGWVSTKGRTTGEDEDEDENEGGLSLVMSAATGAFSEFISVVAIAKFNFFLHA